MSSGFLDLSEEKQYDFIAKIDEEANSPTSTTPSYFKDLKSLTQWGYFSSKIGIMEGLRYNPIPGTYKGCVTYTNEIAWY